jgi:hypothetical protein
LQLVLVLLLLLLLLFPFAAAAAAFFVIVTPLFISAWVAPPHNLCCTYLPVKV